ncbi:MAG: iron-containing alcohol dehydrogenase [Eubacteriales bacterium]|nr:iron-containing alcohol dehydrogenase [Eubacteriales bacterium]
MEACTFLSPTRLVIGRDAEAQTPHWIRQEGCSRVLVHHDSGYVKQSGLVDRIIALLREDGLTVVELGGVVPNPRLALVREGICVCRENQIDFLLAVGGGSVIDSCKAIGLGVAYDGDVWDFFAEKDGVPMAVPTRSLPIGVVLTIAATGSEASNSCVVTNGDLKRFCDNDVNRPRFAIENPLLTCSLPPFQTACGIVDIMSHSMERYFTCEEGGNYLTDALCEAVFRTCLTCAPILRENPQNYQARANVMVASSLSHNGLTGIGRTGDWASHFIEHELSGEFDVTHGAGLAVIIPAWMRYVWPERPNLFLAFATRVMGVEADMDHPELTIQEGIRRLEDFFRSMGLPTRLRDMPGVGRVDERIMEKMARRVRTVHADGSIGWVKRLYTKDIVVIFQLAQ